MLLAPYVLPREERSSFLGDKGQVEIALKVCIGLLKTYFKR
jgi:hypothetical protein